MLAVAADALPLRPPWGPRLLAAYEGLTGLYFEPITVRINPAAEADGAGTR